MLSASSSLQCSKLKVRHKKMPQEMPGTVLAWHSTTICYLAFWCLLHRLTGGFLSIAGKADAVRRMKRQKGLEIIPAGEGTAEAGHRAEAGFTKFSNVVVILHSRSKHLFQHFPLTTGRYRGHGKIAHAGLEVSQPPISPCGQRALAPRAAQLPQASENCKKSCTILQRT